MCKELPPRSALTTRYLTIMLAMSPVYQSVWHLPYSARCEMCIFLDYELREASFYNLNNRSYLLRFTDMFTEKRVPYFPIGPSSRSLTISTVRDE